MSLAIRRLEQNGDLSEGAVDEFIETHEFPIVEGSSITFVFRGNVNGVNLQHWVYGLETSLPLTRLEGTDLWYLILDLPERSRIEYKFDIVVNGLHRWVRDPFNPLTAREPYGLNSVCCTSGYQTPEWTQPDPDTEPGVVEDYRIPDTVFGGERSISVYLPARFRTTRRYPLLVVHDGLDYMRYASLQTVLDNLIDRLEIAHMIVVLVQAQDRLKEYGANPLHSRFIMEDLMPFVEKKFPVAEKPALRGLMGSSFGAVASLHTAWSNPGAFGRLLLQSGSFAFTDIGHNQRGPAFDPIVPFMNRFRDAPGGLSEKLFISCGAYESLIYENRSLAPLLQASGRHVKYVESRDGHNWENWRDRLREGLSWLFPGPLWMIYE